MESVKASWSEIRNRDGSCGGQMLVAPRVAASPIVSAIAKVIESVCDGHPVPEEGSESGYASARACESDLT
jgi:hypothetical protein